MRLQGGQVSPSGRPWPLRLRSGRSLRTESCPSPHSQLAASASATQQLPLPLAPLRSRLPQHKVAPIPRATALRLSEEGDGFPELDAARKAGAGGKPRLLLELEAHVTREMVALGVDPRTAARLAGLQPGEVADTEPIGSLSWDRVQVWENCLRQLGRHLRPYGALIERCLQEFRWFLRARHDEACGTLGERVNRELQRDFDRQRDYLAEAARGREEEMRAAVLQAQRDLERYRRMVQVREREHHELRARWLEDHKRAVGFADALQLRHEEQADSKLRLQQLESRLVVAERAQKHLRQAEQELETQRSMLYREQMRCQSLEDEGEAQRVRLSVLEESGKRLQTELAHSRQRLQQLQTDRNRQLQRTEQLAQELRQAKELGGQQQDVTSQLTPRPHWDSKAVTDALWQELISRRSQGGGGHRASGGSDSPRVSADEADSGGDAAKRQRLQEELQRRSSAENVDVLVSVVTKQRRAIHTLGGQLQKSRRVLEYIKQDPLLPDGEEDAPAPPLARRPCHFFAGLGTSADVPRYLQLTGKIPGRQMQRPQLRLWINDFWAAKRTAEERRSGTRVPFASFLYRYLGGETQHQSAAEMAYSILDAARRATDDVDCVLFVLLHEKQVGEEVADVQTELVAALRKWFKRCETIEAAKGDVGKRPPDLPAGFVSKRIVNRELQGFFSGKAPDSLLQLKVSMHNEQPGKYVDFATLFEEQSDRPHGAFVSLVRQQHLDEVRAFHEDVHRLLIDVSDDGQVAQCTAVLEALLDNWARHDAWRIYNLGTGATEKSRDAAKVVDEMEAKDSPPIDVTSFMDRVRRFHPGLHPVRRLATEERRRKQSLVKRADGSPSSPARQLHSSGEAGDGDSPRS